MIQKSPALAVEYETEHDVKLKFYPTTETSGTVTYMANHKRLVIFSEKYLLTPLIASHNLSGKTLRVNITIRNRTPKGGWGTAELVDSNIKNCLMLPDTCIYKQAPIIMIDGQNFFRTVNSLAPHISAYALIRKIVKRFKRSPKLIRLYICPQTINDIQWQWDDLRAQLAKSNALPIQIVELQAQQVSVGYGYKQKSDIDPLLLKDLGRVLERYKNRHEALVLMSGDCDYLPVCEEWLGNSTDPFCQFPHGRLLMVVSATGHKTTGSLSPKVKEVCNDPNAQVVEVADLLN